RRERAAFLYGNIAADIINFKAYGGPYNHCHRWTIIGEMREHADSEAEEAFLLGYLSHLAADTIAHNHFVPYHLARYARTKGLGHLYWEMSADRFIEDSRWSALGELRDDDDLNALDELVNRTVEKKALPMKTNKLIFNHVLLISHRDRWRAGMERLQPRRKVTLDPGFLCRFQDAAVERIRVALQWDGVERIEHIDPNGKEAQALALRARAELSAAERWFPRTMTPERGEALAARWLEGMGPPAAKP
ncbi:MAG: zinc dependent phospholipase C family protein, partial [Planctomycetota bacterium]